MIVFVSVSSPMVTAVVCVFLRVCVYDAKLRICLSQFHNQLIYKRSDVQELVGYAINLCPARDSLIVPWTISPSSIIVA